MAGSLGPLIGVLAVILVLGIIAGLVGRLCSGRSVFGYGHYDFEGWIERNCASCIDGSVGSGRPPPPSPAVTVPPPVTVPPAAPSGDANGGREEAKERSQAGPAES